MRSKVFAMALLAMVFAGELMGQAATEHKQALVPSEPAVTIPLSPGTAINASLAGTLDSEKSKPGDPVSVIVNESVVYQRSVLIPKGSRIAGYVVRTGGDGEVNSALFVEFDRVILKNGQEAILNAGIQALAPVGAAPTIPSREKYEENRMAGSGPAVPGIPGSQTPGSQTQVMPSTYTLPSRVLPDVSARRMEGGLDRRGLFTPDSKGAFSEPNLKVFTPVSEGSHGTVLVGNRTNVHLDSGAHLLIVIQPPATVVR